MFTIRDEDTLVTVFGSMHLLPKDIDWRSDAFDEALAESDAVYFEISMDAPTLIQAQVKMMQVGRLPEGESLRDKLDEKQREMLAIRARQVGVPISMIDTLKPSAAATMLMQAMFNEVDLDASSGVELSLAAEAMQNQWDVRGLETVDEQLDALLNMSEEDGLTMLEGVLAEGEEWEEGLAELRNLYAIWSVGDMPGVLHLTGDMKEESPEMYERLLPDRNRKWVIKLDRLMQDEAGEFMVVVGAGHLPGDDGVLKLMQDEGYQVRRVQ